MQGREEISGSKVHEWERTDRQPGEGLAPLVQVAQGDRRGECRCKETETEQRRDRDSILELFFSGLDVRQDFTLRAQVKQQRGEVRTHFTKEEINSCHGTAFT